MSAAGPVHVACAAVPALLQSAPPPPQWLGPSEGTRLASLRTTARREQFLAARWQARVLLAQVLGGEPAAWELNAPPDAPPRIPARPDLHLSITHSGAMTACALSSQPVGIDLEHPRRARDLAGLAALCCTPAEREWLRGEADSAFYELWTVKEAWLKRRGEWIAPRRLQQLEALPGADGEFTCWREAGWTLALSAPSVLWSTPQPATMRRWTVRDQTAVCG